MAIFSIPSSNCLEWQRTDTTPTYQESKNMLYASSTWLGRWQKFYAQKFIPTDEIKVQLTTDYTTLVLTLCNLSDTVVYTYSFGAAKYAYTDGLNVYEYDIDTTSLAAGYYYAKITATMDGAPSLTYKSEPIYLHTINTTYKQTYKLLWKDGEDNGIYDSENTDFSFRVEADFFEPDFGADNEVYENQDYELKKIKSQPIKSLMFRTSLVPAWVVEKINIALTHDYFTVNGERFQSKEAMKFISKDKSSLGIGEVLLQKYGYENYDTYTSASGSAPANVVLGYVNGDDNWVLGWVDGATNYKLGISNT